MRELVGTLFILGFAGFVAGVVLTTAVKVMAASDPLLVGLWVGVIAVLIELVSDGYEQLKRRR